ncbi:MAG TPA: 2-phospho-L-lactate guanylyltransferase [Actinocrinis sp.]|nr:2-phospho-L-lactate guanylyltransferase [Actinocrinis sp.]
MWSVIIPVKRLPEAKSRLAPLPPEQRGALALAFAADALAAVLAAPQVHAAYVVTGDPRVGGRLSALGARLVPDPGTGLNGAYAAGLARARADFPGHRVLALNADLPALRTGELGAFLESVGPGRAVVPDVPGTGSTMLAADPDGRLEPLFGPDSRRRHEESGAAVRLDAGPSLRQDVDTVLDLASALRLGVGRYTANALSAAALAYADLMQATVRTFDPATRSGTVLLDDGTEVAYGAGAFDAGALRLARVGQRVALRIDEYGIVTALTLATFPLPE